MGGGARFQPPEQNNRKDAACEFWWNIFTNKVNTVFKVSIWNTLWKTASFVVFITLYVGWALEE